MGVMAGAIGEALLRTVEKHTERLANIPSTTTFELCASLLLLMVLHVMWSGTRSSLASTPQRQERRLRVVSPAVLEAPSYPAAPAFRRRLKKKGDSSLAAMTVLRRQKKEDGSRQTLE